MFQAFRNQQKEAFGNLWQIVAKMKGGSHLIGMCQLVTIAMCDILNRNVTFPGELLCIQILYGGILEIMSLGLLFNFSFYKKNLGFGVS